VEDQSSRLDFWQLGFGYIYIYSLVDLENESELGKTPSRGTVEV